MAHFGFLQAEYFSTFFSPLKLSDLLFITLRSLSRALVHGCTLSVHHPLEHHWWTQSRPVPVEKEQLCTFSQISSHTLRERERKDIRFGG